MLALWIWRSGFIFSAARQILNKVKLRVTVLDLRYLKARDSSAFNGLHVLGVVKHSQ